MDRQDNLKPVPSINIEEVFGSSDDGLDEVFSITVSDLAPVPMGDYVGEALDAELMLNDGGTPFYRMRFTITSGEYAGRRVSARWYLSRAAAPYSLRALAKLGLAQPEQLRRGEIPVGPVRLRIAVRRDDDGNEWNNVKAVLPLSPRSGQGASVAPATMVPVSPSSTATTLPAPSSTSCAHATMAVGGPSGDNPADSLFDETLF